MCPISASVANCFGISAHFARRCLRNFRSSIAVQLNILPGKFSLKRTADAVEQLALHFVWVLGLSMSSMHSTTALLGFLVVHKYTDTCTQCIWLACAFNYCHGQSKRGCRLFVGGLEELKALEGSVSWLLIRHFSRCCCENLFSCSCVAFDFCHRDTKQWIYRTMLYNYLRKTHSHEQ